MEFVLSWLADYVDLGEPFAFTVDAAGRHGLSALTPEARERSFQIGKTLTAVGLAVEGYPVARLDAEQEQLLDVDITSNRPDCMCHLGVARELAVALDQPLRRPPVPSYGSLSTTGTTGAVLLEDPEGCPRYVARVIRGVRVGPSPDWLRRRLEAIGQRSINNVVDVTNFVLWELGQPLHAFDLAALPGGEIRVRRARPAERLTTLDGRERELDPEILVIADRARAIALAGVMGGLETEVTAATADVLLESAHFDRRRIRNGAKRLALHTDASHRFERGTDPDACDLASRRAAALIVEIAGGRVEEPAVDAVASRPAPIPWRLEQAALDRFAGVAVPPAAIERILGALEFAPRVDGPGAWCGEVPSFRAADFEPRRPRPGRPERGAYPQDLYEEVLRHWGYDRVPASLPALPGVDGGASPAWDRRAGVQRLLAGLGFAEGIHYAFHDRGADERLPALVAGPAPALANPLSDRYAVMRRSLVPNLVAAAEFNLARGATAVRLFEVGNLFPGGGEEVEAVAVIAAGEGAVPWERRPPVDLAELKGALEALLAQLDTAATAEPAELPGILAGTGALWRVQGEIVGWFGRVAATEAALPLFAGELLLDPLPAPRDRRPVELPPRLPGISADLTLTHPLELAWSELATAIRAAGVDFLVGFRLKDRYQGPGVPAGAVATTITFDYHAGERTLAQEEVNARHAALAAELERRFGVARKEPA